MKSEKPKNKSSKLLPDKIFLLVSAYRYAVRTISSPTIIVGVWHIVSEGFVNRYRRGKQPVSLVRRMSLLRGFYMYPSRRSFPNGSSDSLSWGRPLSGSFV